MGGPGHRVRAFGLAAGAASVLIGLALCRPGAAPGAGPDQLVVATAGWLAWLLAMYLAAWHLLAGLAGAGAGRLPARLAAGAPSAVSRAAQLLLGLSVGISAAAAPATAAGGHRHGGSAVGISADWPHAHHDGPGHRPRTPQPASVLVRPGDSLWRIAARALPGRASAQRVAATWPQWWVANRRVIGADPDLIFPGQRLVPPDRARSVR